MRMNTQYDPSPLFAAKPAYEPLEKVAAITLGRDANNWEQEISKSLHKEHPFIHEHNISIFMTKSDPESGTAIGSLQLDNKVLVPIIIDKFKLAPLDLFYYQDKLYPLTRVSLESVLQDMNLGKAVPQGRGEMSDQSMASSTQPPFEGKYTYASSFADALDDVEQLNVALHRSLGSVENVHRELVANATLRKVAEMYCSFDYKDKAAKAPKKLVKKAGLAVRTHTPMEKLASHGIFEVATTAGRIPAMVFNVVAGIDGTVQEGRGMVVGLTKEAHYAYLSKGQEVACRATSLTGEVEIGDPITKTSGVFFSMHKKAGVCTEPIYIDHLVGKNEWVCHDGLHHDFRLRKVAELKAPVYFGGTLSVPTDWQWLRLDKHTSPMTIKEAALNEPRDAEYFRLALFGGRLTVTGIPGFESDGDAVEKTASLLKERFVDGHVDAIVGAMDHGDVLFVCVTPPDTENGSAIEELGKLAGAHGIDHIKEATYIRPCASFTFQATPDLTIKIAAVTDDQAKQTVDAVLGLNFLNPENLYKFSDKADLIEQAKEATAKLLLASRLGLDVDSRPLRTALFALDAVTRDLRELQNAIEADDQTG